MTKVYRFFRFIERKTVVASFLIFFFMLLTKLLGFIKLRAIAQLFGVSKELDVFWAAFAIPDLIFTLLIAGTVNAALIPVFIKVRAKHGKQKVLEVLNSVVNLNIILWGGLWILISVGAPVAVNLLYWLARHHYLSAYLTGFLRYDKEFIAMFIKLTRIMFFSPFVLGISSIFTAFLNSNKRFISASLAPFMYNVGIILTLYMSNALYPGLGIYCLVISIIVGSIFHLFVQLPTVFALGYRPRFILKISKFVKEIVFLAVPRVLGLAVEQLAITFDTFWSLLLGAGALSIFKYATSLHLMPVHLFANSILQATFPNLNETVAKDGPGRKFAILFLRVMFYILWITSIIAVLIVVLKIPIVKLVLGGGKFTDKEVLITALVLAGFAFAIVLQGVISLIIRGFYAIHETKKPLIISIIGVIFNVIFAVLFSNLFTHSKFVLTLHHMWVYKVWHWQIGFSELIGFMLHRSNHPLGVVGLALGITVALLIEVISALYIFARSVPLKQVFLERKGDIYKLTSIVFGNFIGFWVAFKSYEYLNSIMIYSLKSVLIELVLVSLVTFLIYIPLTLPVYWRIVRKFFLHNRG